MVYVHCERSFVIHIVLVDLINDFYVGLENSKSKFFKH